MVIGGNGVVHGLICRAFANFLQERFGTAMSERVSTRAAVPAQGFEPFALYDPMTLERMVAAAETVLALPRDSLLEDMGTALISGASGERLRRLLRFGGIGYRDFLYSLEELPARAQLVLPNLRLPDLQLKDGGAGQFFLTVELPFSGASAILIGLLRAMADDYGALVVLELQSRSDCEEIMIQILDEVFATGRRFDLTAMPG